MIARKVGSGKMAAKTNTKKDSLLIALRKGNAEKVRKIIADGGADGDDEIHADMAADSAMNALLHRAARYGHGKVVQVGGNDREAKYSRYRI